MPRTARQVIPGVPHHVIQRGNRRQDVFFSADDYRMYLSVLREEAERGHFQLVAYCLMRNHIHLVVVPLDAGGLRAVGHANRRYAYYLNRKMQWTGHLWQGRFASYPMDERYCYEAIRYVEMNPVKVALCKHPTQYRWSSARQRVGRDDGRDLQVSNILSHAVEDWDRYWAEALERFDVAEEFLQNETAMRPLGTL